MQPRPRRPVESPRSLRQLARRNPATSHEVARVAGVSRSAVSRTFTEGASVSELTRKKVLIAAKALKYRPNLLARSLKTRRSYIIGIAVSELDNQSYPEMLQLLSEEFARFGYRLLLFITHGSKGHDPLLKELLRYQLDALILASSSLSSALALECRTAGVPVVMLNNIDPDSDITSVAGTNELGARTVAAYLAAAGHRQFGYIGGLRGNSTDQERRLGFASWLRDHGLAAPACVIGQFTFDGVAQATRQLLGASTPPDAIFCINDHAALVALQIARTEFAMEPGADVSIVGFDNVAIAAWPAFSLTTYSQPISTMVSRTVALVRQQLGHSVAPCVHEMVQGELIVRTSARVPPTGVMAQNNGNHIWRPAA
jgi:DNA-binding LacI/PurR family transcriptional regulator